VSAKDRPILPSSPGSTTPPGSTSSGGADGATGTDLWRLGVREACTLRYEQGLREHGRQAHDPFQGDPLEEAYEELIDTLNYLSEFQRTLSSHLVKDLKRRVYWVTVELRAILEFRSEHGHVEESVEDILDGRFS